MNRYFFTSLFLLTFFLGYSQDLIERAQLGTAQFEKTDVQSKNGLAIALQGKKRLFFNQTTKNYPLFKVDNQRQSLPATIKKGVLLNLQKEALTAIRTQASPLLNLRIPVSELATVELDLYQIDIYSNGFNVTTSTSFNQTWQQTGVFYNGIIKGNPNSTVAVSIFEDLIDIYIQDNRGNYKIVKNINGEGYLLFNQENKIKKKKIQCSTNGSNYEERAIQAQEKSQSRNSDASEVAIYIETDYDFYLAKEENINTVKTYVETMMSEAIAIYGSLNIPIKMSALKIHTTPNTYDDANDTGEKLEALANALKDDFEGSLAHLISGGVTGGVALLDVLCESYAVDEFGITGPYAVTGIDDLESINPDHEDVNTFVHELGHNFGAYHTQACFWNGNMTPLDGCVSSEPADDGDPSCDRPNMDCPNGGGTIMSYCSVSDDIDCFVVNKWHPQVASYIQEKYTEANDNGCLGPDDTDESDGTTGPNPEGSIVDNTNAALPAAYNFQEYVYAEPNDQGTCSGATNNTAEIVEVFLAQTHRHAIGHPFFFTIGHRPALLQLAVTGSGTAPDVQVEGIMNGESLGILCLKGPSTLSANIDLNVANFEDYFSVTLPKNWIKNGLTLSLTAGGATRALSTEDLKVGPYTEMNLVMVNMDVIDYNDEPHFAPIFANFLEEMASAIPASVVRFGIFPETMPFPEIIVSNNTEQLVRLGNTNEIEASGIMDDGNINAVASTFLEGLHRSTGDFLSTVYFGNTLNLAPGGWGGGKGFVSPDFTDIFIHELGHALSLPHWEEAYNISDLNDDSYLYPYGGDANDAGSRGHAWNFIQDTYEFEDPICRDAASGKIGVERSDCMQRENPCLAKRTEGVAPWDGFGDFSAIAIHRYLMGASAKKVGQVNYRGAPVNYQLSYQDGFPIVSLENGQRVYKRDPLQNQMTYPEMVNRLPGQEQIEQDVYLVYGSTHPSQSLANILYKPIKFKGTLPAIIDPTDSETFTMLQNLDGDTFVELFGQARDITLKLTYKDGSVMHALNPFQSFPRTYEEEDFGTFRNDVSHFSLVVPGDKVLCRVELFHRPFLIGFSEDDLAGNINFPSNTITAENFMDEAVLQVTFKSSTCDLDEEITGTVESFVANNITVSPNPTAEQLTINYAGFDGHSYRIELYDLAGRISYQNSFNSAMANLNLRQLSTGYYVVKLISEDKIFSDKIIIQR